jgi:hypothetical protein
LTQGKNVDSTIHDLIKSKKFSYLKIDNTKDIVTKADFTSERKSAVYIREALSSPVRCKICNGMLPMNSITIDHIKRKEDGGIGDIDNAQLAHPYCNSTIKN